jgi:hypothetical protein
VTGELELEVAPGRVEHLVPAGASFWGSVHRSRDADRWYRLVPVARVPLEGRSQVRSRVGSRPHPSLAPIAEAHQVAAGGWFAIRYDLQVEHTLAQMPAGKGPSARLELAVRVLDAFPGWTGALGGGLLPMPGDVAVTAAGAPYLLPMPYRWAPGPEAVLEEPTRGWHLAPEVVRGRAGATTEAADRYALGATLLRLFAEPDHPDPAELLLRAATGTVTEPRFLRSLLPNWLEGLPAAERLRTALGELLKADPEARGRFAPDRIAAELTAVRPWTVPAEAVRRLEVEGRRDDAWVLLLETLEDDGGYELLLAGGRLAARDPRRQDAAVQLLERAIEHAPEKPAAYQDQIEVLVARAGGGDVADLILRDFPWLPGHRQDALEVPVAQRLLALGHFHEAAKLVYPRLFRNGSYLWWKLELNLCYAEALLGLPGRRDDARRQLDRVDTGLDRVEENRSASAFDISAGRAWLARLRGMLDDGPQGTP